MLAAPPDLVTIPAEERFDHVRFTAVGGADAADLAMWRWLAVAAVMVGVAVGTGFCLGVTYAAVVLAVGVMVPVTFAVTHLVRAEPAVVEVRSATIRALGAHPDGGDVKVPFGELVRIERVRGQSSVTLVWPGGSTLELFEGCAEADLDVLAAWLEARRQAAGPLGTVPDALLALTEPSRTRSR